MNIQEFIEKTHKHLVQFDFAAINTLFSQPLLIQEDEEEYLEELEILVDEIRETLFREGDYSKAEVFVKTLETHQPEILNRKGKYFYHDFVEHFCAAGDFEKAEYYFEPFIKRPVNEFDMYLSVFKKLLFFQRNTILQRAIQQNYEEVRDSDLLFGNAAGILDYNIYFLATQEVYEKSDQNFDIKLLEEKLKPFDFDLSEDPIETYNLGFYADMLEVQSLMNRFEKDQDAQLMLLRNSFMKRMLIKGLQFTLSGLLFDLTRIYWDENLSKKKKANWKNHFKIKYETFDNYLGDLKESFIVENYDKMIALVWGVAYVYDFLLEAEIIDTEQYAVFQHIYKRIVAENIGNMLDSLNAISFVMQWPKPEVFTQREWEAQQSVFKKSKLCEADSSIDIDVFIEEELEDFGVYKIYVLSAYKKRLKSRNELLELMLSLVEAEKNEGVNDDYTMYDPDYIDVDHEEVGSRKKHLFRRPISRRQKTRPKRALPVW
ncbi:MAG: hypothetical protein M0Q90_04875 [Bacteroidales bacterium]|nr:hypothetical protein [Bacteroidales bacterium]